jgi:hypothetical protein
LNVIVPASSFETATDVTSGADAASPAGSANDAELDAAAVVTNASATVAVATHRA